MQLRLNLRQNAFHTLHRAIIDFRSATHSEKSDHFDNEDHSLTFTDPEGRTSFYLDDMYTRPPRYYDFKFCILNLIQAIELLLKEVLRTEDPDSIFTDATRTKTITLTEAINKTLRRQPELLNQQQLSLLIQAKTLRNTLEHFEINWPRSQFEIVARHLFAIIVHVSYSCFNTRLQEYYSFDPWKGAESDITDTIRDLMQLKESPPPSERTITEWLRRNPEDRVLFCSGCGHESLSITLRKCVLCGQELDDALLPCLQ